LLKALDGTENTKCVLYFDPPWGKKGLPLNVGNLDACYEITGESDSDDFVGHKITLFPTKTTMGSKIVDCIRIKAPAAKKPKPAAAEQDSPPDDGVPFNDGLDDDFADEAAA
jgi:hypothetical protein